MTTRRSYLATAGRLRSGLEEIEGVVERTERIWRAGQEAGDDWFVDAVALNLHGFYAGVERLFQLVAETIDENVPSGAGWHVELLAQMAAEIPGVRPALIDPDLKARLDRYRGFRHVVRNVYTFNLDAEQIDSLVVALPDTAHRVSSALIGYAELLESLAASAD